MKILAIETSCDETAVAVTDGRRVLSNVIYSQVLIHKKWGGVVPSLAKKAHEERIDFVIEEALKKLVSAPTKRQKSIDAIFSEIDYIAVTYGPGLAIALEVGIKKAKELAKKYNKKLIAVDHMEGHIYANFAQNQNGNPDLKIEFPYLALLISGGHTELVLFKNHIEYEKIGQTLDDAVGEALDKAAKLLGLGYPGGPIMERLAEDVGFMDNYHFPRPMMKSNNLDFSYSGLKTSFYYFLKKMNEKDRSKNLKYLASSFQEAAFDVLLGKTDQAIKKTKVNRLLVGGGVSSNKYLRKRLRNLTKKHKGEAIFPPYKYLCTDNAAMIGVAAYFKAKNGIFVENIEELDRIPRLELS